MKRKGNPQKLGAKRVVIYARVSRDDTGKAQTVTNQINACKALCEARGWTVVFVEKDVSISAWSGKKRPGWLRVLDLVQTGQIDIVCAWHIDRLTRSMLDLEQLILLSEDHGVGVATATGDIDLTTDVGRMVARILAAVARAEVERKAARQRLANEYRANQGMPSTGGARPFGYARDMVTIVPEEADAIRVAAVDILAGVSLGTIAKRWESDGLVSSRASGAKGGWTGRGVRGVMLNPRYASIRRYNGIEVGDGTWPAILDRETHLALRAKLLDPSRTLSGHRSGRTPTTLLTGIATCSVCKEIVRGSSYKGRLTYACRPSGHVQTTREGADEWVRAKMIALLSSPDALSLLTPSGDKELDELRAEAGDLRERLNQLAKAFAARGITQDQLVTASTELRERLEQIEPVLASGSEVFVGIDVGTPHVKAQWDALPLERRRALIEQLVSVTLHSIGKGKKSGTHLVPIEQQVDVTRYGVGETEESAEAQTA